MPKSGNFSPAFLGSLTPATTKHGGMHRGEFPEGVNAYIQYGQNLSSLLVNLSMDGMSADHLHKTIGRMFDIPLSTGTIINKLEKCAGLVSPLMDRIKEKIVQGPVAHFDETGIRVDGRTKWVHSSSNRDFTYLTLSEKRGKDGMDENGVIVSNLVRNFDSEKSHKSIMLR